LTITPFVTASGLIIDRVRSKNNSYMFENLEWDYTEKLLCFSLNK